MMIQVDKLTKVFRVHKKEPGLAGSLKSLFRREWLDKHALRGVSFGVEAGEIVGLVGANGAGKTTLVKILSGIIHSTGGTARVLGFDPWQRKNDFRRQIALIMGQKAQLWWDLPAADCFLLLREIYQIPKAQFDERLDFLVHTLDVAEQLKIQIRRLSLGERMKMELIAALLHQPRVVFLDEPTIGLDLTAQRAIRDFIKSFRAQHNPAMILTSHYMEDIKQLCERIIIIREGEIVYDGPLASIVARFAAHKIVVATLAADHPRQLDLSGFPVELGQVTAHESETIRFKVPRERVAESAALILQRFPVIDVTIEEDDIAHIIEAIMREGRP